MRSRSVALKGESADNSCKFSQFEPVPLVRAMSSRPNISGIGFTDPKNLGNFRNRYRRQPWLDLTNIGLFGVNARLSGCYQDSPSEPHSLHKLLEFRLIT